jgi:hypothetical protein
MFKTPKEINKLLPIQITASGSGLDKFFAEACQASLHSPEFVTADQVRSAAARPEDMLESAGLPVEVRHGAVATHLERGGSPSSVVRPAVHLQLRRGRKTWWLQKYSIGLTFPYEPIAIGITLTWRQRAYILWMCAPSLQAPWV